MEGKGDSWGGAFVSQGGTRVREAVVHLHLIHAVVPSSRRLLRRTQTNACARDEVERVGRGVLNGIVLEQVSLCGIRTLFFFI